MKKYLLKVPNSIKSKMWEHASKTNNEVCGVLIGKKVRKYKYQITHLVYDDKAILSSPIRVTRNTKNLYPPIKEIVENSPVEGIDYIGDWHSHPNMSCRYSFIDQSAMKSMLKDPDYNFLEGIVLVIVRPPSAIKGYLFLRENRKPLKMDLI